jgi:general secretion pathway protein C
VTAPARLARICDGTATAAATPTTTEPTATTPAMTTSASNDVDPATAAAITAGVTTHAGRVEVAASLLARVTAEPMAFARGVRIVPAFRDGQAEGFKLYAIRPGSLAAALGLANGDTLLRLAGHSLVERDGDTAAWIALRDARAGDTITLELVRRAAPVTLSYHLR